MRGEEPDSTESESPSQRGSGTPDRDRSLKDRFKDAIARRVEKNRQRFEEELSRPMGEHLREVSSHLGRAGMRTGAAGKYILTRAWQMKRYLDREADPDEDTDLASQAVALQMYRDIQDLTDEESSEDSGKTPGQQDNDRE